MWRWAILVLVALPALAGDEFTFVLGNAVAAQQFQFKSATFVFRVEGCPEPAKPELSATAEGLIEGQRKSLDLKIASGPKPGIYAVFQTWPSEGRWLVNLKGVCGSRSAGAMVPVGPKGFLHDSAKLLSRPATGREIETSLEAMPSGGKK